MGLFSSYPFIDKFQFILNYIYKNHYKESKMPTERIICNLIDEVPKPTLGKT